MTRRKGVTGVKEVDGASGASLPSVIDLLVGE